MSSTWGSYALSDRSYEERDLCQLSLIGWLNYAGVTCRFFTSIVHCRRSNFAVEAPVRPLIPANRSLRFLETGAPGSPQVDLVSSRAAVPSVCVASTDRLSFIDPLPMDRLFLHDAQAGLLVRGASYSLSHTAISTSRAWFHSWPWKLSQGWRAASRLHSTIPSEILYAPAREWCNLSGLGTLNFNNFMLVCAVILYSDLILQPGSLWALP